MKRANEVNLGNEIIIDDMRDGRSSDHTVKERLRECATNSKIEAVLVVEGYEDSPLYGDAFTMVLPNIQEIRIIVCGGKNSVLGLRNLLQRTFSNDTKTMFFVDRDHDDFLELHNADERTYVTDFYSIEWDFCTEDVLFSIISKHYTLNERDPIWNIAKQRFRSLMTVWLDHCRPVMQAVVVAKQMGEKLTLKKIFLSDICRFKAGTFQRTSDEINAILSKSGCVRYPDADDLSKGESALASVDSKSYVRGKLMVQFCCIFFKELNEICGKKPKIDSCELESDTPLGKNNFIRYLPSDWKIPESLRDFYVNWRARQTV